MEPIAPRRRNRSKCLYRPLQQAKFSYHPLQRAHCTPRWHLTVRCQLRACTQCDFCSTNLDTKRRVYLERHGGDVIRVNTALATLGPVLFAIVTITAMPPLIHNLLLRPQGQIYTKATSAEQPCVVLQRGSKNKGLCKFFFKIHQ